MRLPRRSHAAAAVFALPTAALAAVPSAAPAASVGLAQFAQVFGALVLILGLIFGLALAAQRLRLGRGASGRHLRVVDALALGTRERLLLVDVAGERVLLGVAAGRIERLHVLPPGAVAADAEPAPAPAFPGVLAAVLGGRKDTP
ncbi:MAG TPA: flagellar biosynthetic protein FliO [Gammaproteobacteria bacterium]|nr:flagellar biosynthetic protein FliO [Gammaproteobacteria bacterium]